MFIEETCNLNYKIDANSSAQLKSISTQNNFIKGLSALRTELSVLWVYNNFRL